MVIIFPKEIKQITPNTKIHKYIGALATFFSLYPGQGYPNRLNYC